jgi:SAM-dependent methyltransferase
LKTPWTTGEHGLPDTDFVPPPQTSNCRKFQQKGALMQAVFTHFFGRLAEIVEPLAPGSVLDAGCGEGETIERLRPLLPDDTVGIDHNPACIDYSRRRHPGVEFAVHDITRLPYEDDRFDLVLCNEVLEHLDRPEAALAELTRVGRHHLVVSVPHEPWFDLSNRVARLFVPSAMDPAEHVQHWTPVSLRRLLEPWGNRVDIRLGGSWLLAHVTLDGQAPRPTATPPSRPG